jgi:DNA-nicking Smr family endonuclease
MSRRTLSDEEEALWTGFVRSIRPLQRGKAPLRNAQAERQAETQPKAKTAMPPPVAQQPPPRQPKHPPLAPLGRRVRQRVARGRDAIDDRIDLHGMTQTQAHGALLRFLRRAQANDAKIVLIVTGKGSRSGAGNAAGDSASERGVLRRQVPLWLALPEFRPFVVGFEDAHVSHGGQGALYVRLRRGHG